MGGELREIVDAGQVGRAFALAAIILPLLGLAVGAWWGRGRQQLRRGALFGLLIGLLGPLNWLLWYVYNRITDSVGLDTVRNLVINLVLFLAVGAIIGTGIGLASRRLRPPADTEPPTDNT